VPRAVDRVAARLERVPMPRGRSPWADAGIARAPPNPPPESMAETEIGAAGSPSPRHRRSLGHRGTGAETTTMSLPPDARDASSSVLVLGRTRAGGWFGCKRRGTVAERFAKAQAAPWDRLWSPLDGQRTRPFGGASPRQRIRAKGQPRSCKRRSREVQARGQGSVHGPVPRQVRPGLDYRRRGGRLRPDTSKRIIFPRRPGTEKRTTTCPELIGRDRSQRERDLRLLTSTVFRTNRPPRLVAVHGDLSGLLVPEASPSHWLNL
jgi:hypothetical protein